MLLSTKNIAVGDKRQYFVNYWKALREGDWLVSGAVTTTDASVTISAVQVLEGHVITFFVQGGTLNQPFTVTVVATDNTGAVSHDTVNFNVSSP